jgi:ABC-2 type transport system permease protein
LLYLLFMRSSTTSIIRKELLSVYRDKTVMLLAIIIWLLLASAMVMGTISYAKDRQYISSSRALFRQQWEQQQRNPHDAAHFGTYLFNPVTLLGAFDTGLNDYFGTSYRVEAHKQNEVNYSNAESSDATMRFGQFTIALILQLLVPLLILFTACSSVSREKESGTLKMLLAQGVKPVQVLWGKVWANYLVIIAIILPLFICLFFALLLSSPMLLLGRFLINMISYLLYYLLVVLVAINISAISKTSRNALLAVLCLWLFSSIILPKLATGIADSHYPLMSRATFKNNVEQAYRKGLNGKDPYYERGDRYLKQLLKQYHADTTSQLPVDAAGIIMQLNEDYQNMVFDHYRHQIDDTFTRQQDFLSISGLIDPFIALKRISMATAGTDFYHHNNFFNQARAYRNGFIRKLNLEVAHHPKDGETFKSGPAFFKSITDFHYQVPGMATILKLQWLAILSLTSWVLLMCFLLQSSAKHPLL